MNYVEGMALPPITAESAPFWAGCQEGELRLQHCTSCDHLQFYPRMLCTQCGSTQHLSWQAASGRAQLLSHSVVHLPVAPVYADEVPYLVALVKLAEGPTMMTNLVNLEAQEVTANMALQVVFRRATDEVTLPLFEPVA